MVVSSEPLEIVSRKLPASFGPLVERLRSGLPQCGRECCFLPSSGCPVVIRRFFPTRSEFADNILSVHPSDVLDMPVDPNEPTYCLCHQVSYGEMIGCDNPDVSGS